MINKIKFKRKLSTKGTSVGMTLPPELLQFVNCKSGDNLIVIGDTGAHGNFIAVYKNDEDDTKPAEE